MGAPNTVNKYGFTVAVHGDFCTGCDARTGRCGDLTQEVKAAEQKTVDDLQAELHELAEATGWMTPLEAAALLKILKTGDYWFVTKPLEA